MENIQVALRIRPLNREEIRRSEDNIWVTQDNKTVALSNQFYKDFIMSKKLNASTKTSYSFDYCFTPDTENTNVYQKVVRRVALSSLNGINGTIFMYGQTGSGKTYTMMGYNREENIENEYQSYSESPIGLPHKKSCDFDDNTQSVIGETSGGVESNRFNYTNFSQLGPKGYNMKDISQNKGVLILALKDIFQTIEKDLEKTYFLRCSYVEIYNDQIYDLLKSPDKLGETLAVNEDAKRDFYIKGVTEEYVSSIEEILEKLKQGEANRHYAQTIMNHASSRSHTIFRLMVQTLTNNFIREYRLEKSASLPNINNPELRPQIQEGLAGPPEVQGTIVTESLLNFVDLAGSEKVSNHHLLMEDGTGIVFEHGGLYGKDSILAASRIKERVKEGQHINKSLFFLTQVISLKSEGKSNQHIPYRNSPLTKILRSSLGGNSRTLIILCTTPATSQFEQTLSTLRFGMNAKKIENRVQANIVTNDEGEAFRILISDYERKLKDLENLRQEDQVHRQTLIRQVEELQLQRCLLMDKINAVCKVQVGKMIESIPKDDIATFFKQMRERAVYFDRVGVLFPSKALNKYDVAPKKNSLSKTKNNNRIYSGSNARLSFDSSSEEESETSVGLYTDRRGTKARSLSREKAKEVVNQLSLPSLKVTKRQVSALDKKVSVLEENYQGLFKKHMSTYENYLNIMENYERHRKRAAERSRATKEVLVEKYEEMRKKYRDLAYLHNEDVEVIRSLKKDLGLYKDMNGISKLNDEELASLERHLWEKLDVVKVEKARRVVQRESTKGVLEELVDSEEHEELRKIVDLEEEQEDMLDLSDESFEEEMERKPEISKEENIEKEKKQFMEMWRKGLQEIEEELEQSRKTQIEVDGTKTEREKEVSWNSQKKGRETARDEDRKNSELLSSRSRAKEQKIPSIKLEQKLDFVESLAEFRVEVELPKLKGLVMESDGGRIKSSRRAGLNMTSRTDRERNTQSSLVLESKETEEPEVNQRKGKEVKFKEEGGKLESPRTPKDVEMEKETRKEFQQGKVNREISEGNETTLSLHNRVYSEADKSMLAKTVTEKELLNKKILEDLKEKAKKGLVKTCQEKDWSTGKAAGSEKVECLQKEGINTSRRGSSSAKKEDITKSYKTVSGGNSKDINELPPRLTSDKRAISSGKKGYEKTAKRKKDGQDNDRMDTSVPKFTGVDRSTEKSPNRPTKEEGQLGKKHRRSGSMEGDRESKLTGGMQENFRRNLKESLRKTIQQERNRRMNYRVPSSNVTMIGTKEEITSLHYLCYSARNGESQVSSDNYGTKQREKEEGMSSLLMRSRNSSITRNEGDLNISDIGDPSKDDSKKRRTREDRKKKRADFGEA